MSDILIKNMKIPKDFKYVDVRIFRDGTATTSSAEEPFYKKMDVIELPKHGRLIDADAMNEKYGDWYTEEGTEEGFIGALKYLIAEQPIIIEGDGKDINVATNADRIRAMSDEELAEFIGNCVDHEFHLECICFLNRSGYCQYPTRGCNENALEWLKQEVET